ncbi:CHAT domain-containing protein [Candidatus Albibeggiatoa sp. nov. NOAA]|uniref:CHAT domain-containing protein n=1 Tax=Candidatus Albibeggiatoa sp. nov. NOAA TaxID=3162724 RepID=UPI0032F27D7B|nr:CHAT domain-containing protein [Thiotrichaceae bacterium]
MRYFYILLFSLTYSHSGFASHIEDAYQAYKYGFYEQAIEHFDRSVHDKQLSKSQLFDIYVHLSKIYQHLGDMIQAEQQLVHADRYLEQMQSDKTSFKARLSSELSRLYLLKQRNSKETALHYAQQAIMQAKSIDDKTYYADALLQLAHLQVQEMDYETALANYQFGLNLLKNTPDNPLYGKILLYKTQVHFYLEAENAYQHSKDEQAYAQSLSHLYQAFDRILSWESSFDKVLSLLKLSQLTQSINQQYSQQNAKLLKLSYAILLKAKNVAEAINNPRAKSYIYGNLGKLYETQTQYKAALSFTRQALFFAQQSWMSELVYTWYWQIGRIFNAQHQTSQAIDAYQQAIDAFHYVRNQMIGESYCRASFSFHDQVATVYYEFADLLLKHASVTKNDQQRTQLLHQARHTIELYKTAELQNYYQDTCLDTGGHCIPIEKIIAPNTAVIYPIPLEDRLELLVTFSNAIVQKTIPITNTRLEEEVSLFLSPLSCHPNEKFLLAMRGKQKITDIDNTINSLSECSPAIRGSMSQYQMTPVSTNEASYLEPAQTLYQWLIEPLEAELKARNIDTLVVIPEGILRTMPYAALHDGKQFLIEEYAIAISPSLCLSKDFKREQYKSILLSGLSEAVQGFDPIPCAAYELQEIQKIFQADKPLINQEFVVPNLQKEIKQIDYSILHIASHGQFKENLADTFVLTYDDKLSMDKLERLVQFMRLQGKEVNLLTLSACETAVGNDRAALGLAGVAIKAGVKSAFASLWQVDDVATPAVVIEFYNQLKNKDISMAKALQNAQKQILSRPEYKLYQHPYYWSAFLLIGNWQ